MKGLSGKRIAITASRKTEEMMTLVEKQGGSCVIRPMQGTSVLDEPELESQIQAIVKEGSDWMIFTTGIGTELVVQVADKLGIKDEFLDLLQKVKVANRGYKTFSALKNLGITPLASDDDGTTRGLVRSLEAHGHDFTNQKVIVQLHGDAAPQLTGFLRDRGARVTELLPYRNIAPEEEVARKLVEEICEGKLDAVCFTTAVQVQNLFSYAKRIGRADTVREIFQNRVLAVAVGKITAEALEGEGIERIVAPENERMGAMIVTLSNYMEHMI